MQIVRYPVECDCGCKITTVVEVNLYTGEHQIIRPAKTVGYRDLITIVTEYKRLKGYDVFPTWDKQYRGRAFKRAKEVLGFFAALPQPLDVGIECMREIDQRARKERWNWNLETIVKLAPDWLREKQKEK